MSPVVTIPKRRDYQGLGDMLENSIIIIIIVIIVIIIIAYLQQLN